MTRWTPPRTTSPGSCKWPPPAWCSTWSPTTPPVAAFDKLARNVELSNAAITKHNIAAGESTKALDDNGRAVDRNNTSLARMSGTLKTITPEFSKLGGILLALPAAMSGIGLIGGALAGVGGAFIATGLAASGFGAVAVPILKDAETASKAVRTAQDNYNAAIASGTPKAQAYKTEQLAINKAYEGMSPQQIALSKQLGNIATAWDQVKKAETPVVSGALQPWLEAVTPLLKDLSPIIAKVAPVIHDLGVKFGELINSQAFKTFIVFVSDVGSAGLRAFGNMLLDLFHAFILTLPTFTPLFEAANRAIAGIGPAVMRWASSQKTADQITAFMQWVHDNGPVLRDLIENIGKAIGKLAPGLAAGGIEELRLISDFFGLVAKLPKNLATPIAEVAGAMLLLSKLGVLQVGIKWIGLAAAWVTRLITGGGTVALEAAGMQRAGDTMAGAAVAMQRAADTMAGGSAVSAGAAKGGAGVAATGAAVGGSAALWKTILGTAVRISAGVVLATVVIQAIGSLIPKDADKQAQADLKNSPGVIIDVTNFFHITNLGAWIDQYFSHPIRTWVENTLPSFFAAEIPRLWSGGFQWFMNTVGSPVANWFTASLPNVFTGVIPRLWSGGFQGFMTTIGSPIANFVTVTIPGFFTALPSRITGALGNLGGLLVGAGGNLISGLFTGISNFFTGTVGPWFAGLPGRVMSFMGGINDSLGGSGNAMMHGFLNGVSTFFTGSVVPWFTGLPTRIAGWFTGAGDWLSQTGGAIITGLFNGINNFWNGSVVPWFTGLPARIVNWFNGAPGWLTGSGSQTITGLFNGITSFWNSNIVPFFTSIPGKLQGWFNGAIGWLVTNGSNIISGLFSGLSSFWNGSVVPFFTSIPGKLQGWFAAAPGWLVTNGSNIISGLFSGLSNFWNSNVVPFFTSIPGKLQGWFAAAPGWLVTNGSNIISGLASGITSFWNNNIVPFFTSIPGKVTGWFNGAANWLVTGGNDIIRGLLNGIGGAMSGIGSWVNNNIVQPVIGAVKQFFGISSPSTVFAEIGGHLMSGLVGGILKNNPVAIITKVFGGMPKALASLLQKGILSITQLPAKALSVVQGLIGKVSGAIGSFVSSLFGGGGSTSGVEQWRGTVLQALSMLGMSSGLANQVLYQMQTESGRERQRDQQLGHQRSAR